MADSCWPVHVLARKYEQLLWGNTCRIGSGRWKETVEWRLENPKAPVMLKLWRLKLGALHAAFVKCILCTTESNGFLAALHTALCVCPCVCVCVCVCAWARQISMTAQVLRSSPFWDVAKRRCVVRYGHFGTIYRTPEDRTDRLSRNADN